MRQATEGHRPFPVAPQRPRCFDIYSQLSELGAKFCHKSLVLIESRARVQVQLRFPSSLPVLLEKQEQLG